MSAQTIDRILNHRRIVITCGTGGVGKTTLSAALALRACLLGKRAVVITIDPAKRLATSLGLESLGDHATDLTPLVKTACEKARRSGLKVPDEVKGTLAAIMPDTRRTFETFVKSLAPTPEVAERVMKNTIFQTFAREFSGSNEYMALERLFTLDEQRQYDCIILDTPPSRNTLDFLDAPKLLARFFEERLIRWLVLPANRLISGGMRKALSILENLTGAGFMTSLFDFAQSLFEVRVTFTANLKKITELLESESVGFMLVTSPTPETAPEVAHFVKSIGEHGFHFDGIAVNRTLGYLKASPASDSDPQMQAALHLIRSRQDSEDRAIQALLQNSRSLPLYSKLPELARDVHSVEDLFHVAMALDQSL